MFGKKREKAVHICSPQVIGVHLYSAILSTIGKMYFF
jgi:hypothetical protein